jgi:hypothetical protein
MIIASVKKYCSFGLNSEVIAFNGKYCNLELNFIAIAFISLLTLTYN